MKELVIIGCGPKAVAIATKAHVLKELGRSVPNITIIDKFGVAANWDGTNGHTDGATILGTTPLEDVGFPYVTSDDNKEVNEAMLRYSFMAFMIDCGRYAEWVDRGQTPPSHTLLADYYKWVINKIQQPVTIGIVKEIQLVADSWHVFYEHGGERHELHAAGVVITGPGKPYRFPYIGESPKHKAQILNGQTFWTNIGIFDGLSNAKIAVIGAGETAAAVTDGLLKVVDDSSRIDIVTRHPILFTRNENWREVMYFSRVENWSELSKSQKKEVIHHVDRGTFSVATKDLLDSVFNVDLTIGSAERIELRDDGQLILTISNNGQERQIDYDFIIEATGFNPFSFKKLFPNLEFTDDYDAFVDNIDKDLSIIGLPAKLHVPNLSAMAQGPGFPNLSSLGLLADRILEPYVSPADAN